MRPILSTVLGSSAPILDTQVVDVGYAGSAVTFSRKRGYISAFIGGITDGTSNIYGGAAITECYWAENNDETSRVIVLQINGIQPNSGWTAMNISGNSYQRAAATFSTSGGKSTWTWDVVTGFASNPFGGGGGTRTVTFT